MHFQLYLLDRHGRRSRPIELFCDSDPLKRIRDLGHTHGLELWREKSLVTRHGFKR